MSLRPERVFALPADRAACRASIRQGSRSFHLASLLLPAGVREPAYAVYAFCRMADDVIDAEGAGARGIAQISAVIERAYGGRPAADPIERAFADVVSEFAIPRSVPEALVEGLAWDVENRRYATLDDLKAYAVRVAGTVGLMMSLVMRRDGEHVLARACDLGVAMQLTNICRDVGEDARNGRLYLPTEMLEEAGADLARPGIALVYDKPVRVVVGRLLDEAEALYDRALCGIDALPGSCRAGIGAARLFYRAIGHAVVDGVDPVRERAIVPLAQKLALLPQLALESRIGQLDAPVLPQAAHLIDAVASAPRRQHLPLPAWWRVGARAEHLVEMLSRLPQGGRP